MPATSPAAAATVTQRRTCEWPLITARAAFGKAMTRAGPLERFEATRDLRLLDGETIRCQAVVGLRLELGPDVGDPPIELVEANPAACTGAQMRMAISPVAHRRAS